MSDSKTAMYICGVHLWFFPELGRKAELNETIELPVGAAEKYMASNPGLLRPARHTTQAHPQQTRDEGAADKPKRRTRAKA